MTCRPRPQTASTQGPLPGASGELAWQRSWRCRRLPAGTLENYGSALIVPYSNCGFIVAGVMMEERAGADFGDLMTREVFLPLGMTHSGFGSPGTPGKRDQPWGHSPSPSRLAGGRWQPLDPGDPAADITPISDPNGRVHVTLADMARFAAAHLAGVARRYVLPVRRVVPEAPDRPRREWLRLGLGHDEEQPVPACHGGRGLGLGPVLDPYWQHRAMVCRRPTRPGSGFRHVCGDKRVGSEGRRDSRHRPGLPVADPGHSTQRAPARYRVEPDPPVAGRDVVITYLSRLGPLAGSKMMILHHGVNRWQQVQDAPMSRSTADGWVVTVNVPQEARQIDFVFTNGERWDNNSGGDWHKSTNPPSESR